MNDIVITGLTKSFGNKQVLKDFSMTIPAGGTTCIMAPSGGGKTTLMNLLLGLISADSGTIQGLEGIRIAAVFQEDRLIETMNPVSNIRLVHPRLSTQTILERMSAVGLNGCAGQPVSELSGGMRRRVALLRALESKWDFLLMDEPFKGLDHDTLQLVIQETRRASHHKTVLLITHDLKEADMMHANLVRLPEIQASNT